MSKPSDRKRAKHDKRRAEARARARACGLPDDPAVAVALAATKPFGPCWIACSYDDPRSDELASLVTIVLTRRIHGDRLLPVLVLVDRTCLGIKGAVVLRISTATEIAEHVDDYYAREGQPMRPCDVLLAQSIVFRALDYARGLGFVPHPDTPIAMFEPRPAALLDTRLACRPRPLYVEEQGDDVGGILAHLEAAVGSGNYDTALEDRFVEDVVPEDGLLRVDREPFMPVRLYYEMPDAEQARAELETLRGLDPEAHMLLGALTVTGPYSLTVETPSCRHAIRAMGTVGHWLDTGPTRVRIVNRCFAEDEGTTQVLARWLDRDAQARGLDDDVPLVEEIELDPDDATAIGQLILGIAIRGLRALRHWEGDTHVTFDEMIRMVQVHACTVGAPN